LAFAWRAVRCVKSNAIVLARVEQESGSLALVGMGAGQPARRAWRRCSPGRSIS